MNEFVYQLGVDQLPDVSRAHDLLGGKGANLFEMSSLGLPVPPGFTITSEVCSYYFEHNKTFPLKLKSEVNDAIAHMESVLGNKFGSNSTPLLVSVRSGSRFSMPGMMDTVLNLGLNNENVLALADSAGNTRFAYDSYRRFIQMYGDVVLGLDSYLFEEIFDDIKDEEGLTLDTELSSVHLKVVIEKYLRMIEKEADCFFPQSPQEQLWGAISAVFGSWMNERAQTYRRLHGISESWGTAVTVQAMVFGNMGDNSATGVCFSRNPSTGENKFYGEYLVNAQGEDVVAGIRTPHPLTKAEKSDSGTKLESMEEVMPKMYAELLKVRNILEVHYKDMQDMEFTVQQGKLWMLQTRNGKRTARAALKIACDMVDEGMLSPQGAIGMIDPSQLDQLLHPTLDPNADSIVIGRGLPSSPGAVSGRIVFDPKDAESWVARGEKVILVRTETSPEDINGMNVSSGILTTRGGMTSHAAVVARGMGKPCISGAGDLRVDLTSKSLLWVGGQLIEGDTITIDGATGSVYLDEVATSEPQLTGDFSRLMNWADQYRTLGVRTNAETPEDALIAKKFGAEGIGLSRTEHMFFDPKRIIHMREMILASDTDTRRKALEKLLPYQCDDFYKLFKIMEGLPVTIRLLDPPLNEFLPSTENELKEVAEAAGAKLKDLQLRKIELDEVNPMLGHRGCRLGITFPEVYEMQARAIFLAAARLIEIKERVNLEIMIPLIVDKPELDTLKELVEKVASEIELEKKIKFDYQIGSMIELPRACLKADEIAKTSRFFSFGTNDLTQTTYGFSRDDAAQFLEVYLDKKILPGDPFISIDRDGVGELIKLGVERGRKTRPELKVGICGEHGGDPKSIHFCQDLGLSYVSCSPFRVPIARLAAAQAAINKASRIIK